jgi:acyl carrier protein
MNSKNNAFDKLSEIWRNVLGIVAIGPQDDFFALGGNSLKAASMIFKTEQAFDVEIPLSMVAGSLTLDKMLALLETLANSPASAMEAGEL